MSENPYIMKLHQVMHIDNGSVEVRRVPGGWIYTTMRLDCGQMTSVFVPYKEEGRLDS